MTRVNRMEPLGEALRHELAGWRFDESMRTRVRAALAAEVQAHPSAAVRTGARGRGLERKPSVWWWTGGGLAVAALALFWSARAIGPGVEERSLSRAGSAAAPAAQVAAPAPAAPAGGEAGVVTPKEAAGETVTALAAGTEQPVQGAARPYATADASIANARPERDLTTRTAAPSRARTTPDELARSAAVIAQVRVRAAANGEISVVVERPFKGTASGAELRLLWPAGPTPAPAPETRLFLFAEPLPDRPGLWRPVGDAQGVYRISADGTQAATDDDPATPVPVEQLIQAAG